MNIDWSVEGLETLHQEVEAVLVRHVTVADLPELYTLLTRQALVLDKAYRTLGRQEERIQALEAELQALRGAAAPWDEADERGW